MRTQIVSKKINPKLLEADDFQDLKARGCRLTDGMGPPRAQPQTFRKLVFLIYFSLYCIFLNWLSGAAAADVLMSESLLHYIANSYFNIHVRSDKQHDITGDNIGELQHVADSYFNLPCNLITSCILPVINSESS